MNAFSIIIEAAIILSGYRQTAAVACGERSEIFDDQNPRSWREAGNRASGKVERDPIRKAYTGEIQSEIRRNILQFDIFVIIRRVGVPSAARRVIHYFGDTKELLSETRRACIREAVDDISQAVANPHGFAAC